MRRFGLRHFFLRSSYLLWVILACGCSTQNKKVSNNPVIGVESAKSIENMESFYTKCHGRSISIAKLLDPIVKDMVSQKILYSPEPSEWRDCSGNFLRLSSYIAARCPDRADSLVASAGIERYRRGVRNKLPGVIKARSSRDIARWYHKQNRFTPIYYDDAPSKGKPSSSLRANRHRIKVGTVLWFSRKAPKSASGIDNVFKHINHMAVVTDVKYNSRGELVKYKMYHGRNKGKLATVTEEHFWAWPLAYLSRGSEYPPLGYWSQYLVGVGRLL